MTSVIESGELPSGIRLHYAEQGDRAGVPVLLLHGLTDSGRSFEPVLRHLPASLRAIALSQRGHGDADRPLVGYRPHDFAADVAAFMDVLELGPAVIVGHSMESRIAQRHALDHPERTLGLVLWWDRSPPCGATPACGGSEREEPARFAADLVAFIEKL